MFAALEFLDFAIISLIILIFSGGSAATAYLRPLDRRRLERLEDKLDLILIHLGLEYTPAPTSKWQELAMDAARKIDAIKAYREEHGVGLAEAKGAVEAFIEGRK